MQLSQSTAGSSTVKPSASLADYVWVHMAGLYGHAWTSSYGDDSRTAAGAEWARTLHGLTRAQVGAGFDACRAEGAEFPPSAPRFRGMCLGIPTLAAVSAELLTATSDKRTPFARLVWSFIVDLYAYRHTSAKDAERLRREAYEQACEHLMTGGGLPSEPAGEIAHDDNSRPTGIPKTREHRVEHLRGLLGLAFNEFAAAAASEEEVRRMHRKVTGGDL